MAALPASPGVIPQRSNNAVIIFITQTDRILLIRSTRSGEWGVPGGKRDGDESDYECALREFREETSFSIEPELITNFRSELRSHSNRTTTKMYIIRSTQVFPPYDPSRVLNRETDALEYLKLTDLYDLIFKNKPHGKVTKLRHSNLNSLRDLFLQNKLN
jgi:8-oxo-dGTP pyrophosphatase MutT (NUDIX family)